MLEGIIYTELIIFKFNYSYHEMILINNKVKIELIK